MSYVANMQKTFVKEFARRVKEQRLRISDIAEATGVSKDQLYRLSREERYSTNVDDAIKIAAYFGQTVNEFVGGTREEIEDTLLRQIAQLSQAERKLLAASLRALLDARDQNGQEPGEDEATTSSDHHQTDRQ